MAARSAVGSVSNEIRVTESFIENNFTVANVVATGDAEFLVDCRTIRESNTRFTRFEMSNETMKEERFTKLKSSTNETRDELPKIQSMIDSIENAVGADEVGEIDIPARDALSTIRTHLNTVDDVINAEQAHNEATEHDAREKLSVGDTETLVIKSGVTDERTDDDTAFAYNENGIATFINGGEESDELTAGEFVEIRFSKVMENSANAILLDVLD